MQGTRSTGTVKQSEDKMEVDSVFDSDLTADEQYFDGYDGLTSVGVISILGASLERATTEDKTSLQQKASLILISSIMQTY